MALSIIGFLSQSSAKMPRSLLTEVESILSRGTNLDAFGSANWGLSRADVLEAISKLRELRVAILGGDVWTLKDGKPVHTRDSWFCQRHTGESFEIFFERSIELARKYVEGYPSKEVLFEIVVATG